MAKSVRGSGVDGLSADQPTHIVLFRETGENAISTFNTTFERRATRSGISAKMNESLSGQSAHFYEMLGVATVSMSQQEAEDLRADPAVEEVFVNEIRSLPTPISDDIMQSTLAPSGPPALEYLRGLRDGIDLVIGGLSGEQRKLDLNPEFFPWFKTQPNVVADLTWGLEAIGITKGYRYTGKGIKVAVLDTGIDLKHPDLRHHVKSSASHRSFIAGETVQDLNGHGTHCCGTVAGAMQPQSGPRYGVAPDVDLLVGKVLSNAGTGRDDGIVQGIQWAASQGARVISLSLGSSRSVGGGYSRLYERLAERLLRSNPGTLLVAATGNDSRRPISTAPVSNPAACPSILGVAAVDVQSRVAYFSCRTMDGIGHVDISGPGVNVLSARSGGGTTSMNGTSMATPHVAGVAALIAEANPGISASAIWDMIVQSARNLGDSADFGAGMVRVPV